MLPKKYLKITDEEWNMIEDMIKKERVQQLNRLQDIKNRLFGKEVTFDNADKETLMKEFKRIYELVYTETKKECNQHIKKVEQKFDNLSSRQKQYFDVKAELYKTQHEKDEFEWNLASIDDKKKMK